MKIATRDVMLLTAPAVVLCAVGFALQHNHSLVPRLNEPFRLTLHSSRFEPLTPYEVSEGYDTKVAVVLGHRGAAPAWWGKQSGYSGTTGGKWQLLFQSNGRTRPVRDKNRIPVQPFRWQAAYDNDSNRYSARYLFALRDVPAGDEIRLRDRLSVEAQSTRTPLCPPVWVDVVARKKGQATSLPRVSRNSGLKLEHYEIDRTPPVVTQNQAPQWRVRVLLRRGKFEPPTPARQAVGAHFEVCDARGDYVSTYGSQETGDSGLSSGELSSRQKVHQADFYFDPANPPPAGALWIKGRASLGTGWPLRMRFPFRDHNGRVRLTPRAQPAFLIVSASAVPPVTEGARQCGADALVKVVVQAIGTPAKPMQKWEWQADYSQHVADASGKRYWIFPFKDGAQTAWPEFSSSGQVKNQIIIYYALKLSHIPRTAGTLTFKAMISANGSQRVPVQAVVRAR
jgi:hypothetical protein